LLSTGWIVAGQRDGHQLSVAGCLNLPLGRVGISFAGFPAAAFDFYAGLGADNSRSYWAAHRDVYEDSVRAPLAALLGDLAVEFGGQVSVFRPFRDVRFARGKSPYKTHQGGFLEVVPGVGYHLQLDADGLLVGGGFHARDAAQTRRYRAAVTEPGSGEQLAAVVASLAGTGFTIEGDQVTTRPRGVTPDHPRLDLVRRKWLTASRRYPPGPRLAAGSASALVRSDWTRLRPLIDWITAHCPPGPETERP
jgi:uncharacterized protein (TIGR02453 family)